MLTFSGYKAFSFDLFSSPLLNKSGQALASAVGYMGDQWPPLEWLRYLLGKKQDRNYITFKPRPQNEVCHKKYNCLFHVTFQNSFYCAAPRNWNTLPYHLRNIDCSVCNFKKQLFNYYLHLIKSVYDVNPPPQTYKSVCINCHTTRPLTSCSIELVVDVCPYSVCYFCFYCFHKGTVIIVSIGVINIIIFCYFLDLVTWLALWVFQVSWRSL